VTTLNSHPLRLHLRELLMPRTMPLLRLRYPLLLQRRRGRDAQPLKIIRPCCGSGLVYALQVLEAGRLETLGLGVLEGELPGLEGFEFGV
jgi:hypothetical protein